MLSKNLLEKLAMGLSLLILAGLAWFWTLQVQDVIELLRLAAG